MNRLVTPHGLKIEQHFVSNQFRVIPSERERETDTSNNKPHRTSSSNRTGVPLSATRSSAPSRASTLRDLTKDELYYSEMRRRLMEMENADEWYTLEEWTDISIQHEADAYAHYLAKAMQLAESTSTSSRSRSSTHSGDESMVHIRSSWQKNYFPISSMHNRSDCVPSLGTVPHFCPTKCNRNPFAINSSFTSPCTDLYFIVRM